MKRCISYTLLVDWCKVCPTFSREHLKWRVWRVCQLVRQSVLVVEGAERKQPTPNDCVAVYYKHHCPHGAQQRPRQTTAAAGCFVGFSYL